MPFTIGYDMKEKIRQGSVGQRGTWDQDRHHFHCMRGFPSPFKLKVPLKFNNIYINISVLNFYKTIKGKNDDQNGR